MYTGNTEDLVEVKNNDIYYIFYINLLCIHKLVIIIITTYF